MQIRRDNYKLGGFCLALAGKVTTVEDVFSIHHRGPILVTGLVPEGAVSVKSRIDDAESLWAQGRKEGAWVQALIAAAATARKRYPRPIPDNQAFKSFICDVAHVIMTGSTDGPGPTYIRFYSDNRADHRKLEDIFYTELRCNLVHEGELKDVGFSESKLEDGRYEGTLSVPTRGPAEIPDFWVLHLIAAVKAAPENSDLFRGTT